MRVQWKPGRRAVMVSRSACLAARCSRSVGSRYRHRQRLTCSAMSPSRSIGRSSSTHLFTAVLLRLVPLSLLAFGYGLLAGGLDPVRQGAVLVLGGAAHRLVQL